MVSRRRTGRAGSGDGGRGSGGGGEAELGRRVFLSTFEKQLDAKRRIVVPQEFRASIGGLFDGVFCFPSIEADCIEGGGKALFDRYIGVIDELPFGDPLRSALETTVLGGVNQLSFDTAGRVTLPESLCDMFGLGAGEWVSVVGLRERFQIWPKAAFEARRTEQRLFAREGLPAFRTQQRVARAGAAE